MKSLILSLLLVASSAFAANEPFEAGVYVGAGELGRIRVIPFGNDRYVLNSCLLKGDQGCLPVQTVVRRTGPNDFASESGTLWIQSGSTTCTYPYAIEIFVWKNSISGFHYVPTVLPNISSGCPDVASLGYKRYGLDGGNWTPAGIYRKAQEDYRY